MLLRITIRYQTKSIDLEINSIDTLHTLKEQIYNKLQIPMDAQVLTYNDRALHDDKKTISDFNIEAGSSIYLQRRIVIKGQEKRDNNALMKNPLVKNFLKNPNAIKSISEMFPGLKEEMKDNPELRNLMNSTNVQEELEMMCENPEYVDTQLKNLDITMSRLENMPGGLNMINSMLKDVRDPLINVFEDGMTMKRNLKEGKNIKHKITEPLPGKVQQDNLVLRYKSELAELRGMGFGNASENLALLVRFNGNLEECILHLSDNTKF